jgi:glutamate/tyrosine decarboxylase-like PLP-dependent enzyme
LYADALVAGFNPQMAAWSHSPFACEAEAHVIRALGGRFGYDPETTDGVFCSGGAEANHTAVLTALINEFPYFGERGARGLAAQPVFYVSAEAHHSFHKAARLCGIGLDALRAVPVDAQLRMRPDALSEMIAADRWAGLAPFLIVATAGTTNAGVCDPIPAVARVAQAERLWLHVDAAWGGGAAFAPSVRHVLAGIEQANAITFDAHKWLSVPMGAGIYLTRHRNILTRTFGTPNSYMPKEAAALNVIDPHQHSMQWSRRFTGLKVFLSLAVAGWQGYEEAIEHSIRMGALLKDELRAARWRVVNETPLPVACFTDEGGTDPQVVVSRVVSSGKAWCSTTVLGGREKVIRACITNYATQAVDVRALVSALGEARK